MPINIVTGKSKIIVGHKDILILDINMPIYDGGTDKISHGAIPQFTKFIEQEQPKWKHIIIEGDRFFRKKED